jgi:hypothetical protein
MSLMPQPKPTQLPIESPGLQPRRRTAGETAVGCGCILTGGAMLPMILGTGNTDAPWKVVAGFAVFPGLWLATTLLMQS